MGATNLSGIEATGVHKILCLLDALRHSQTGSVIYRQVERLLDDVLDGQQTVERAYVTLVNQLLEAYLGHLRQGSPLQIQVRLLQARLQPPLTPGDLKILGDYVAMYSHQIEALQQFDSDLFQHAVEPLLEAFGITEGSGVQVQEVAGIASKPEPEPVMSEAAETAETAEAAGDSGWRPEPEPQVEAQTVAMAAAAIPEAAERPFSPATASDEDQTELVGTGLGTGTPISGEEPEEGVGEGVETQVDTAYRSHLDSKRRDIQKLQSTLAQQVLETIAQNEEFGVLLEVVLGELRQAGEGKELEDLRWTLIREIEKLTRGHHELAEKLDSTHHYLQLIESDSRQLNDELTRVRLLSLTDELTGLPNRRAFLRRIEDEVARVQRYGFPLSLALIDLDHFKQVNDKYGHAGGDEVLQMYSKNILSIFRHHDLVARYGGEEFAVLLPNTEADGSLRALTKVKKRALETRWQANGELIQVPTFSAGLSLYKPGETASAFIERADKALYQAKRLGRNRVELDATYRTEAESGALQDNQEGQGGEL